MFWTELDSVVHRVPLKHHLFILMDANARTGVRTSEEERKIVGAYGRDLRANDSNGIALMQFASDNKLALVNTFFSTKWKEGTLVPCSGELRVRESHEHCLDIAGCYWGSAGACSAKNQDTHRQ